jgi:phosphotransferase system HPr (HPr) family protein
VPVHEITLTLSGKASLHARPAALLVQVASRFSCDVRVSKAGGDEANGKSILGILGLDVGPGATVTIRTEGEDAEQAMSRILELVESDFAAEE